jgi:Rrf2 family protein
MLSFSRTTGYAILALGCIARWKGEWVLSKTIHECTGVPIPYLRKTLFALSKGGIVRTKRGYRGGFVLARPAREITFLDVVKAVEGHRGTSDCLLGLPKCAETVPCPLRRFWRKERARIEAELSQISLADASEFVSSAWWGRPTTCPVPTDASIRSAEDGAPPSSRRKTRRRTTRKESRRGACGCERGCSRGP